MRKYLFRVCYAIALFILGYLFYFSELVEILSFHIHKNETNYLEYDYIVVGAGTAGSVMALRLAEDPKNTVLLLEAGTYGISEVLDMPLIAPLLHKSVYDWQYKTTPQQNACWAFKENASSWPMGRIFGGSGRLNHMLYTRGHPQDFKAWYKDVPNFDYETEILQYFKKSENQIGSLKNDTKYHSQNGPLAVNDLTYSTQLFDVIMKAAEELKLPRRDISGKFSSGFTRPQVNMKNGLRYTTAHYLLDKKRRNLTIKILAEVENILFRNNFEAYGVKYNIQDQRIVAKARKGVILSGGTVATAKLLMLSGVGPKNHLESVGIRPKIDLPVGENLQDHISSGFDMVLFDKPLDFHMDLMSPLQLVKYALFKTGILTSVGVDVVTFLNSNCLHSANYEECEKMYERPDFEIIFMQAGVSTDNGRRFKDVVGLADHAWDGYFSKFVEKRAVNFIPIVLRPQSRGYLLLKDNNPKSKPIINPNYLSVEEDVDILIKGLRFVKRLVETKPMREAGAKFNDFKFPKCTNFEFDSDEYWRCYVKHVTFTLYHPIGTCKMGAEEDVSAVVTRDFRVKGTNKLFVADGSVIPELIAANTNAAIAMIAEKAADAIKYREYLFENVCKVGEIFVKKTVC